MLPEDFEQAVQQDHRALDAFVRGDAEPKKRMYAKTDDVTLANPFGPPSRGWDQVAESLERAASLARDGEPVQFERISAYATQDMGYTLDIEHARFKVAGSNEMALVSLRATTIYRRVGGEWKCVHRQADPITSPRSPETVIDHTGVAGRARA